MNSQASASATAAATASESRNIGSDGGTVVLPSNRFEIELEFVQALASPAYWHFLSTWRDEDVDDVSPPLLQDPDFLAYLRYLYETWRQPEYARFLTYPHALYLIQLMLPPSSPDSESPPSTEKVEGVSDADAMAATSTPASGGGGGDPQLLAKEWTLPAFRNFVHQQQFLAWQHRHATLYGCGTTATTPPAGVPAENDDNGGG